MSLYKLFARPLFHPNMALAILLSPSQMSHMNYSPALVPPDAVLAIPSQFASLNAMSPCGDIVIWPCS